MNKMKINKATNKLLNWIKTWEINDGAYNGYVIHRGDSKRLKYIHDTPWSQGPIIQGLINIYNRTQDETYYKEAKKAVKVQMKRLNSNGSYDYAGFEDDRFSSLVHNSLANCALLEFAKLEKEINNESILFMDIMSTVKTNIDEYLIKILWDENYGAFKFSAIDYYSLGQDRFVANMNSVAVESLIIFYELTNNEEYLNYALRIGEWILTQKVQKEGLLYGAISYAQTHPDMIVSIYTALALRGIDDLYRITNDVRYKNMMIDAVEHLYRLIENDLFYHASYDGELRKEPYFIAGIGLILKAIEDVNISCNTKYPLNNIIDRILSKQTNIGGIKSFLAYNGKGNGRKNGNKNLEVWEDSSLVMGWNAHAFEFLSRHVTGEFKFRKIVKKYINIKWNYIYIETTKRIFVLNIWPIKSMILLYINKKKEKSIISLNALNIYSSIRKFINCKK
ncbi:hypothetical protein [Crassaminicella profunda]|uniref:hypothetical protein n=1 Tax=Crassaminicella profunda TaxID=1286698 RepID=UPI001CA79FE2|nr:hypothetical protein [Crassaminicella profunda]QZY55554.1 hypothetical protein K7H06_00455 [Crassaminicella profunda]